MGIPVVLMLVIEANDSETIIDADSRNINGFSLTRMINGLTKIIRS